MLARLKSETVGDEEAGKLEDDSGDVAADEGWDCDDEAAL